jgi:hypothetical protein
MAHIELRPHPVKGDPAYQLIVNGVDVSMDVFTDLELVKVGNPDRPEYQESGLRVTFAVDSLTLGDSAAQVDSRFDETAEAVSIMSQAASA